MHKDLDWRNFDPHKHWIDVYGMVYATQLHSSEGGGDMDFAGVQDEYYDNEPYYGFIPTHFEDKDATGYYAEHIGLTDYGCHDANRAGGGDGHARGLCLPDYLRPAYERACRATAASIPDSEIDLEFVADPSLAAYDKLPKAYSDWEDMFL